MFGDDYLFPEVARDRAVPEWRGLTACVWPWCPGHFDVVAAHGDGVTLLRCSACGHEHLEGPVVDDED